MCLLICVCVGAGGGRLEVGCVCVFKMEGIA